MPLRLCVLLVASLTACLMVGQGQRQPDWDKCNCNWASWQPWSECSKQCWGRSERSRQVNLDRTPECRDETKVCDAYYGYYEWRDCNTNCAFGNVAASSSNDKHCACPKGRFGDCCDRLAVCGRPPPIPYGSIEGEDFTHGARVVYSCHADFNLTGVPIRVCQSTGDGSAVGTWTGASPSCVFAHTCRSDPCQNGGTCEDGLNLYTCHCAPGWSGLHCEQDVQPPVWDGCPSNRTVHTASHQTMVNWSSPRFQDPLGQPVLVTSNYEKSESLFPWGDFAVQYSAVKPTNGLQSECTFYLHIRPHPCPPIPVPVHGLLVCNGWREDYGRYCLTSCLAGFSLAPDAEEWLVCGAAGRWSSNRIDTECLELKSTLPSILPQPQNCTDVVGFQELRSQYISALLSSAFNSACLKFPDLCRPENVHILCNA